MNWPAARAGAVLTVDLAAIRANYRLLCDTAAPARCAAVLKADAYGLGAAVIGAALYAEGCRDFFVAHLDEGMALRPHLPGGAAIYVLHGPAPGSVEEFVRHALVPVLNSIDQMAVWSRAGHVLGAALPAIVQVDSGMARMGLADDEVDAWVRAPGLASGVRLSMLMSHLGCADQPGHPANARQLARFGALQRRLPPCPASLANSSGIFLGPGYHFDLVRSGAALYGLAPLAGMANPLRQAVHLAARILQVRDIPAGEHVGYAAGYTASTARTIATVAIGYADGWMRSAGQRCFALVDGVRVAQVGNVSMDSITLDCSGLLAGQIVPGQLVDLVWEGQTVDDVAAQAGTIGYEILTGLGPRISRRYVG
ncbi:MAG: alanine racemase [Pseudomonadota bacterium]|nr:alanine racemase [Pseudomonadota bacterium]